MELSEIEEIPGGAELLGNEGNQTIMPIVQEGEDLMFFFHMSVSTRGILLVFYQSNMYHSQRTMALSQAVCL